MIQVLRELYSQFDLTMPQESIFPQIMNYHFITLQSQFINLLSENSKNEEIQEDLLKRYEAFIQFAIAVIVRIPRITTEITEINNRDGSLTRVSILDYWMQEQEENNRKIFHLNHSESSHSMSKPLSSFVRS